MTAVEAYGITGEQSPHGRGNGCLTGAQQQMDMIGHQGPRIADGFGVGEQFAEPIEEILPVGVILENRLPFDPTDDDMLQRTWCIYSGLAGHAEKLAKQGS